jgi:hypothetical protein
MGRIAEIAPLLADAARAAARAGLSQQLLASLAPSSLTRRAPGQPRRRSWHAPSEAHGPLKETFRAPRETHRRRIQNA